MTRIVTAKELGGYLKLSDSTIYKLASNGDLPGFKIGDSWRFDLDEIMVLIKKAKKESNRKGGDERGGGDRMAEATEVDESSGHGDG
jgi:excisionase family DNA binding protein